MMEAIREGDETITDGEKVAKLITAFFAKWFARLPEEQDRDKRLAACVLSKDKSAWTELVLSCGIPSNVSEKLWQAFQPRPLSKEGEREAAELNGYVPSLEEFKDYISTLNPRSAPGFSGLSYLMVKLWPEPVTERAYECLKEAWLKREGLEGWGIRLLAPIPKKTNPELKDVEVLRMWI
jgi:hypothetical protein